MVVCLQLLTGCPLGLQEWQRVGAREDAAGGGGAAVAAVVVGPLWPGLDLLSNSSLQEFISVILLASSLRQRLSSA